MNGTSSKPEDSATSANRSETSPDKSGAGIDASGEPQDPDAGPSEAEDDARAKKNREFLDAPDDDPDFAS